jgi:TonB family protein
MSSAGKLPLTFKIFKGGVQIGEQTLTQDVIKVGKLSSAHLRIDDESVSRMHAYIQVASPTEIYISDLGSAKGTIVNGQRVNKAKLNSGDRIRLGDTEVVVEFGAPTVAAAAPAVPSVQSQPVPSAIPGGQSVAPGLAAVPGVNVGAGYQPAMVPRGGLKRSSSFVTTALTADDIATVEAVDGSRSVEVVAMYKNTAHMVLHYPDPKAGKPSLIAILTVVLGLGVAMAGAGAFAAQIWHVKRQEVYQAKVKEFIKERGLPEKFVPKIRSNQNAEMAGALGFVTGLFCFLWGVLRTRDDLRKPRFTIGEHPKNTFHTPMEALPPEASRFPLVRSDGTAFSMTFTSKMDGYAEIAGGSRIFLEDLVQQGQATPSAEIQGAYEFPIPEGLHAKVEFGDNSFIINTVASGKPIMGGGIPAAAVGLATAPITLTTGGSLVVIGLFALLFAFKPAGADSLESDSLEGKGRFSKVLRDEMKAQRKELKQKPKKEKEDKKKKFDKDVKIKGPAGKVDDRVKALGAGPPNPNAASSKPSVGKGAGMLGVLSAMNQKLGSMFSRDSAVSSEAEDALGALMGHTVGDEAGLGGLGLGGGGRGGGGSGAGGVGFGGWGGFGKGGGGGGGGGFGLGGRGFGVGKYRSRSPRVFMSRASVSGGLDAATIRRVIRRHLSEIKYCYMSIGLPSNPQLAGMVKVSFTITSSGSVGRVSISQSTLNHGGTEACIKRSVRRWRFPKPEGSMPFVTYPFHFKPKG